jgi:hypothetical protein
MFVLEVQPQSPTAVKLKFAECKEDVILLEVAELFKIPVLYAGYFSFVISNVRLRIITRTMTCKIEEQNFF